MADGFFALGFSPVSQCLLPQTAEVIWLLVETLGSLDIGSLDQM